MNAKFIKNKYFDLITKNYVFIRFITGFFVSYFFINFYLAAKIIVLIKNPDAGLWFYKQLFFFSSFDELFLVKLALLFSIICSSFFALGVFTRLNALIALIMYIAFYNYDICINQPHITYINYILLLYCFNSEEDWFSLKGNRKFTSKIPFTIITYLYLIQMSISGFSKLQLVEWVDGSILEVLNKTFDPTPGIYAVNYLPKILIKTATWFVLLVETVSFLLIFFIKKIPIILILHSCLFLFIIIFVPNAGHVALGMLIFVIFMLCNLVRFRGP